MKYRLRTLMLMAVLTTLPMAVSPMEVPTFDDEGELLTELMHANPAAVPVFQDANDLLARKQFTRAGRGFLEVTEMAPEFDASSKLIVIV